MLIVDSNPNTKILSCSDEVNVFDGFESFTNPNEYDRWCELVVVEDAGKRPFPYTVGDPRALSCCHCPTNLYRNSFDFDTISHT